MAEAETITRKWGNSLGIALPKELIQQEHLGPNQRVFIEVKRVGNLCKLRGVLKTKKTTQQLKEEMREGWE